MRTQLPQARQRLDAHPGLLLQRYVAHPADGSTAWQQAKPAIQDAARTATPCELYKAAFDRWKQSLPELTVADELQTLGRLIVGLGTENVLETGIRLHHTYGMPILPGLALKGLAAHYCDQVWGERDNSNPSDDVVKFRGPRKEDRANNRPAEPQGQYHKLLFGTTDDSGCIIFHDAWFVPDSESEPLKLDVMTPHHSGWNNVEKPEPPTDFDSPVPVPFLSVSGKFHVAVSWCGPASNKAEAWRDTAMDCLRAALFHWGIGGKTTSGYGRFDEEKWNAEEQQRQKDDARRREAAEKEAAITAMSPIERSIKEFLEQHPNKAEKREWFKLFEELKKSDGRFGNPDNRKVVAARIRAGMQADKVWKDKGKDGERKKFIEDIFGE
jgi:CRISPR-associated protein Cmr6